MRLSSDEQNGSITLKFMTLLQCGRSLWATGLFRIQYAPNPADEPWPLSAEELSRGVRRVRSSRQRLTRPRRPACDTDDRTEAGSGTINRPGPGRTPTIDGVARRQLREAE
jgi:hypothetical protein